MQVIRSDNERCISVNMEAAPRMNNGQDAGKRLDLFSLGF